MTQKTKILVGVGLAALVIGTALYFIKFNKKTTVIPKVKYPSLVNTQVNTEIKASPDSSSQVINKYDKSGIELMVTDTKITPNGTWYNVLDYDSGYDGWVTQNSVDFKL